MPDTMASSSAASISRGNLHVGPRERREIGNPQSLHHLIFPNTVTDDRKGRNSAAPSMYQLEKVTVGEGSSGGKPPISDRLPHSRSSQQSGCSDEKKIIPQTGAQTAWEMLSEELQQKHITTSCEDLDGILGGGIHCKEVTEIGGVPGIGKTQLGIQLAINVQIPDEFGGLGGKAIYVDTEGSFMVERAYQIAQGCIEDTLDKFSITKIAQALQEKMDPNFFLSNIFYFRVCSYTEQIAVINYLEQFLAEHRDVKILVIDSISFHFRQDFEDLALRTRVLGEMSLKLMKLAKFFNLAVLLLNQVTTKFQEGSMHLSLALGDSWSHACTNRIILYWNNDERYAYIDKSPSVRSASSAFSITTKGIRNVVLQHKKIRMM